jgi:hypothetical protein
MKARARWCRGRIGVAAAGLLAGCGSLGGSSSAGDSPSFGDRFNQVFSGRSQAVGEAPPAAQADEPTCPTVLIRQGASTYSVGAPGQEASGTSLRYQGTITRTARDCTLVGGEVHARLGIQGRVIVGPAGAPPSVELPLRVAVVAEGINPKTVFTNAYRTTVAIPEGDGNVSYSLVAEDIVYPVPAGSGSDAYVFYVGFDPQALKPAPQRRSKKR